MLRNSFRPILRAKYSTQVSAKAISPIAKLPTRLLLAGAVLTVAGIIVLQNESRTVSGVNTEECSD